MACVGACSNDVVQEEKEHWKLSEQYVFDTLLQTNANLSEAVKEHKLIVLRARDLPDVYPQYLRIIYKMGLRQQPTLYLDAEDRRQLPQAAAHFTRQGKPYIIINPNARASWNNAELIAVLAHELVHVKEKHVTARNLTEASNRPEISIENELLADRIGSGPLGSCDPLSLLHALKIVFDKDRRNFLIENPQMTQADYNALPRVDHPRWEERKAALEAMAKHLPRQCRKPH